MVLLGQLKTSDMSFLLASLLTIGAAAAQVVDSVVTDVSSPRALQDIHRRLMNAKELQQEYTNSTTLDYSWQDATLFEMYKLLLCHDPSPWFACRTH
jgi:hypothetical protein